MKQIKFRVWDVEGQHMRYGGNWLIDATGLVFYQFGYAEPMPMSRDEYIPMFWTGLKDKNGREIYEGDLLEHHLYGLNCLTVHFPPEAGGWMLKDERHSMPFQGACQRHVEVIGNIHEHPELLE